MLTGDAAGALIGFAEEINADLLVLGSKGMKGPARFLLGSVPNRCAHHAPCSVLIVRTSWRSAWGELPIGTLCPTSCR